MRSDATLADGGALSAPWGRDSLGAAGAAFCISLQERERVRLGFDLHDGPAQSMSAALLQLKMLEALEGDALTRGLAELREMLSCAIEEIYGLIEHLGDRSSPEDGLVARVKSCVDTFSTRSGIAPVLVHEGDAGPVSPSLEIAVFRIVQEALSNVSRHSGARRVDIRLRLSPSEILCEIEDDGHGFDLEAVLASRRGREPYGLHGMSERARMLDGTCTIDSAPHRGTRIRVEIPVWRG